MPKASGFVQCQPRQQTRRMTAQATAKSGQDPSPSERNRRKTLIKLDRRALLQAGLVTAAAGALPLAAAAPAVAQTGDTTVKFRVIPGY